MSEKQFKNNSAACKKAIESAVAAYFKEAGGELKRQTAQNTHVKSGQLKGSWDYNVDTDKVTVGSPLENAIWEEFGTGEYALNGDGRKDVPWVYQDDSGQWHQTTGKKPRRAFWNAYNSLKGPLIKRAGAILKAKVGGK